MPITMGVVNASVNLAGRPASNHRWALIKCSSMTEQVRFLGLYIHWDTTSKQLTAFNIAGTKRLMITGSFHSKVILLVDISADTANMCAAC